MINLIKFFLLLALIVWLGGIIFFAAAEAPTILHLVNDRALGGSLINQSLWKLHWMGLACGLVFLVASLRLSHTGGAGVKAAMPSHLLVLAMIACTLISQRAVLPAVALLRMARPSLAVQQEFMRLHTWAVGLELTTLVMGIVLVWLTAKRMN